MKKNVKKTIVTVISLLLCLAFMTGCSSSTENNGKDSNPVTQTPGGEEDKEGTKATPTTAVPTESAKQDDGNTEKDPEITGEITDAPQKDQDDNKETPVISKNDYSMISVEYKNKDLESTFDFSDITRIVFSDDAVEATGKKDVRITKENGRQMVTITDKGKYLISGTCSNGQIIINADQEKDVRLILNGLNLTCTDSAVIYERQCDKLLITMVGDTENTLTCSGDIVYDDVEKKNPDACIFAKDDLVINGNGILNVKAPKAEGIHSTDSIKIVSGTINIDAGDRALRGKKYIAVKNANINIVSGADAIRTTVEDNPESGYIVIEGGDIKIETVSEGIQATGNIQITGGNIEIKAEGKKANAIKSDRMVFIENASVTVNSEDSIKANAGLYAAEGTVKVNQ